MLNILNDNLTPENEGDGSLDPDPIQLSKKLESIILKFV